MNRISALSTIIILVILSCSKPMPTLDGVDLKAWNADKNGCEGKRSVMKDAFTQQKEKLLGLSEMEIVNLLGRPDHNELYKRNQKFYYYAILPAAHCSSKTDSSESLKLIVRFTAMGVANEVSVE